MWVNYCRIADIRSLLVKRSVNAQEYSYGIRETVEKVITRNRCHKKRGLSHQNAYEYADARMMYWRVAGSFILTTALTSEKRKEIEFHFFSDYFDMRALAQHMEPPGAERYAVAVWTACRPMAHNDFFG